MSVSVGQAAPDFTLKDQSQKDVKLSDFAGKKNVVLVFYPLDWSPTCTNEHVCFVNDMKSFEQLDAEVLGVSVDSTGRTKRTPTKWGFAIRCWPISILAEPWRRNTARISRTKASPTAPS